MSAPDKDSTASKLAIFGICELWGLILGFPPGEDLYHGQPVTTRMVVFLVIASGFAVSGPVIFMIPGAWIFGKLKPLATSVPVWLGTLALLLLVTYGPDIYRRAIAPPPSMSQVAQAVVDGIKPLLTPEKRAQATGQAPKDVLSLVDSLRSQLDDQAAKTAQANAELTATKQALADARRPPVDPKVIPTWVDLDFAGDGGVTEKRSANIHWNIWFGSDVISCPMTGLGIFGNTNNSPSAQQCTQANTVIFLSFDKPVRYRNGDIQISAGTTLPPWKVYGQDEKTAVIVVNDTLKNVSISIAVIK
jgi:hypothetical protein